MTSSPLRYHAAGALCLAGAVIATPLRAQDPAQESAPHSASHSTVQIGFFGNADVILVPPRGERTAFRNGALDLFATAQLTERWSGLVELVFENIGGEMITDLERYQVNYDYSDLLRLTLGRIHNPLIMWNSTQHHGVFLQTPIDKPAMTEWEDVPGLWPVHFTGVLLSGRFRNALGISYLAGIGNGRGSILDEIQVVTDLNAHKALLWGVGFAPGALPGLQLNVTGYHDRIPNDFGSIDENDVTLSASFLGSGWEIRSEWGRMQHDRAGDADYVTTGWYLLLSRSLAGALESVRPYLMVDRLDTPTGFDFFENARKQSNWIGGVRIDLNEYIALKADYRSQKFGNDDRDGVVRMQLAFSLN